MVVDVTRSLRAAPPRLPSGASAKFEVIVVDNASPLRDADAEREVESLLAELDGRLIRHHENGGYSKGMNVAYRHARGRYLLVSNPDVVFLPGCIDALLHRIAWDPETGAATPEGFWDLGCDARLPPNILPTLRDLVALTAAALSPRFVRRYSRRRTRDALAVWDAKHDVSLTMLSGCCFLMERAFVDRIADAPGRILDERFPLYFEDTDLSMRVRRAGKTIQQVHGARLVHLYNRSGQTDQDTAMSRYWISRRLYYRKWYGPLGGFVYDLTRRLLRTSFAKRRAALQPNLVVHDAGTSTEKPVLRLPRRCDRFLVEIALDPAFYLAAGTFGSGDSWTPSDSLFAGFGPTKFWFRVCEVKGRRAELLGVYHYTRVYAPVREAAATVGNADERR